MTHDKTYKHVELNVTCSKRHVQISDNKYIHIYIYIFKSEFKSIKFPY